MAIKYGKELKVGDTIKVWWSSYPGQKTNADTLTSFKQFRDFSLAFVNKTFSGGARIGLFQFNKGGMTIPNEDLFEVIDK